jgi:hypothetical protein
MNPKRIWTIVFLSLLAMWALVGVVMWSTSGSISDPDKVLRLMETAPWLENPNLREDLRKSHLEAVIHSQNLLDFEQRRRLREDGEEQVRTFFESLSPEAQARYADGTVGHHLRKVLQILENTSPETRRSIAARLRRETGRGGRAEGRGDRPANGQAAPPSAGGSSGTVEGSQTDEFDDMIGFGLEMQYHDSSPARKLEMGQMVDNMQAFLQGFRR